MQYHLSKYLIFSSFMLVLLCLGLISPVYSQQLTLEKTWGGSDNEEGEGIACDSSGNVYVTGRTRSFAVDVWDVYLLSYDSLGTLKWQRTWGGPDSDIANDVAVGPSGNIYVTGRTDELGANPDDAFLLCYDSSGNLLWQRTWGGADIDRGNGVAVDSSGKIYVTGRTDELGANPDDAFLLCYDSSGNLLWQRTWGGGNEDNGNGVAVDSSGNIYVTGYTDSFGASPDAFLLSYDSSGNLNWQRTWGGGNEDNGNGVAVDSSGKIYVTGTTSSFGVGLDNAFLLCYDSSGNLQWQRTWGGTGSDDARSVDVDVFGNIYITGRTGSFGLGNGDAYLVCFDSSGRLRFEKSWGGTLADDGDDLTICGDRLCITGRTSTASRTLQDMSGTVTTPTGTENTPTGTEATPSGTESTPSGTETTPAGSETFADRNDSILLCFSLEQPPVGGTIMPISKLAIFGPYLALAGLIAVVSAVYVIKRRKD